MLDTASPDILSLPGLHEVQLGHIRQNGYLCKYLYYYHCCTICKSVQPQCVMARTRDIQNMIYVEYNFVQISTDYHMSHHLMYA